MKSWSYVFGGSQRKSTGGIMGLAMQKEGTEQLDQAILQLLGHRYGDGLVYFRDDGERRLFERAVNLGLVSREGYLTPAGKSFLARNNND